MSHRETIPESRPLAAWLFLADDRRMWHEPHDLLVEGGVYEMEPVAFGWRGLEPSEQPIDAVMNARGPICCRVSAWGEVVRGRDRFVAGAVRVDWIEDASNVLREFATHAAGPIGADSLSIATTAIRMAMPVVDHKANEATRKRARAKAVDGLNERLAAALMGLRPVAAGRA